MLMTTLNFLPFKLIVIIFILIGLFILNGCSDDNPTSSKEPEVANIIISPDSVEVEVGEEIDFSAVALTAAGDTIEDANLEWISSDPSVFTVQDNGTITGESAGTAYCGIDVANNNTKLKAKFVPIGLDSARVRVLF